MEGSSSISMEALLIRARPMASICCSPPDMVPASCLRRSFRRGNRLEHLFLVGGDGGSGLGVGTHIQVLVHGHVQEHMAAFRHLGKAAFHDLVGAHALDALALVQHIAGAGLQQAGNGFQGGGLARAVGTDQGDDLALR